MGEDCQGALGPWPPPPSSNPKILIVAGEASGDAHAARLVAAIKEQEPQAQFFGVGGEALAAEGVRILCPAADLAVVGLSEVMGRVPAVLRALKDLSRALRLERPRLVILVDFPDFNFWVARLARYYRVPVMYYISPQVWAWRTYRVRTIARLVDRMVVIFPFEADFYREKGVPVDYVGHPLRETLPLLPGRQELLAEWDLDPERLTVALLPGSRASEIRRHLPLMLAGAALIRKAIPECQFVLPLASTAPAELVTSLVEEFGRNLGGGPGNFFVSVPCPTPKPPSQPPENLRYWGRGIGGGELRPKAFVGRATGLPTKGPAALSPLPQLGPVRIITGQAYQALAAAHLAVVASGTVTLEAALAGTPTIIVYRLSPFTFEVGRRLVRVEHVGMANLLAGERLFPELLQEDFTPERLAREVLDLIKDGGRLKMMRQGMARIISSLGGPGASRRAAQVALDLMGLKERNL